MKREELSKIVERAKCRVIGWEDARNDGHRLALSVMIRTFDSSETAVLCEPSLARKSHRQADLVLIDPEIGVHVLEVKGVTLDQIEGMEAGGQLRIRYSSGVRRINPINQVKNAMFDVKDATVRAFGGDVRLPFKYWVIFPFIHRSSWFDRFGEQGFCPNEFLFADDLDPTKLIRRLGASERLHSNHPIELCPLDQLQCVWQAFGDTNVLYWSPEEREPRPTSEGTLGEMFDEAAEAYKALSEEQQKLSAMNWEEGPRVVRGVAGSGKTIVLANNLARRLERKLFEAYDGLFASTAPPPRLLAVCFNRTLAPFIEKKIRIAFQQRTGRSIPEGTVEVCSFNRLMFRLSEAKLWQYQRAKDGDDLGLRARQYLDQLEKAKQHNPALLSAVTYDAVYVDEGQDFVEDEFRLLKELCRVAPGGEPNLYVFYDDAQNLYGHQRPVWKSLGLNVLGGRSHVMTECFRNTRFIVEATFNVLYGTFASSAAQLPTKKFGEVGDLEQRGLINNDGGMWRVKFAKREGLMPLLTLATSRKQETDLLLKKLRWLLEEQEVRTEDILVLAYSRQRVTQLAEAITSAKIAAITGIHIAFDAKDELLSQKGQLTLSTVASAKGYDAYCVLMASANEFPMDVTGRASFYVGCTRAIEYLEVFANEKHGLAAEMGAVLGRLGEQSGTSPIG